jgi:polysaccharide pyruvyl transferase WcaK-like protein
MSASKFLLVGNGSYMNRGCEAINQGTVTILDAAFGEDTTYDILTFGSEEDISIQRANEKNKRINYIRLTKSKKLFTMEYARSWLNRKLKIPLDWCLYEFPEGDYAAALEVGGDNYSFDYSYPWNFLRLDKGILDRGMKLVHWGSSIGPFSKDPSFERKMMDNLKKYLAVYVRETRTRKYLEEQGLTNLVLMADPAFVMTPEEVPGLALPEKFIGLNFSRYTARRATKGNYEAWAGCCAEATRIVHERTGLPVVLVPHVFGQNDQGRFDSQDRLFLKEVASKTGMGQNVTVITPELGARQLKSIISKAQVFAGARTHSTIAALSTCVPTLSLAYSVKAWGINEDIFGHTDFCFGVEKLPSDTSLLAGKIVPLLEKRDEIHGHLSATIPKMKALAFAAGVDLKKKLSQA